MAERRYTSKTNWNRSGDYQKRDDNRSSKAPKHSGCKLSRYTPTQGANKGVQQSIVNGWMCHKGQPMLNFTAVTTSKSKLSDKGWYGSVAVTVINKSDMSKEFYWGTMEKATGKVIISDLGIVMNPKGGYKGVVCPYGRK